jgi:hypothetical protein
MYLRSEAPLSIKDAITHITQQRTALDIPFIRVLFLTYTNCIYYLDVCIESNNEFALLISALINNNYSKRLNRLALYAMNINITMSSEISALRNLTSLRLSDFGTTALPKGIIELPYLKELALQNTQISTIDSTWIPLLKRLLTLDLRSNLIRRIEVKAELLGLLSEKHRELISPAEYETFYHGQGFTTNMLVKDAIFKSHSLFIRSAPILKDYSKYGNLFPKSAMDNAMILKLYHLLLILSQIFRHNHKTKALSYGHEISFDMMCKIISFAMTPYFKNETGELSIKKFALNVFSDNYKSFRPKKLHTIDFLLEKHELSTNLPNP